jgi:pyruvate dehydrogenase E1 component alpha subunit
MSALTNIDKLELELFKKAYLIRRCEEFIIKDYCKDEMKTPMHMSMGGEAIAVGVCKALKMDDQVFGTYRSHGIFLAKTEDTDCFFAEMFGKASSLLKGKGGSMHLCAPEYGFMGTSAIVGSAIPLAVGAAFAHVYNQSNKTAVVFFGDGAIDEGVFWESLNAACVMKLPVLFVCEDNGYAVHSPASARHGYTSIAAITRQFNCLVYEDSTTDVRKVYDITTDAIEKMTKKQSPCFLHLSYYRYLEHVGIYEDYNAGYRLKKEFEEWKEKDPILLQRNKLIALGHNEDELLAVEKQIEAKIVKSIEKARNAPAPGRDVLYEEVVRKCD